MPPARWTAQQTSWPTCDPHPDRAGHGTGGLATGAGHLSGRHRHREREFEASAPDWGTLRPVQAPPGHRHVAASADGTVVGWAAVSPVSARPVYAGVVEHSVYAASSARGLGIGKALLRALIDSTENDGIWTIQASIFPENEASLKLHLVNGFTIVGRRRRIARMTHCPPAKPGQAARWRT
ncbi:N-acetyltransferase family protein [Pseudarthrobacter sp. NPDC089323]